MTIRRLVPLFYSGTAIKHIRNKTSMKRFFAFSCLLIFTIPVAAQQPPLILRNPAVNQSQIVFSYAGDLWSVPRAGGDAVRLTTGIGIETLPRFSPDGKWIAFSGEYDGNVDVYVIPAAGGI